MVRFLKKDFWKRSPKPVPGDDTQARQPTNVDLVRNRPAEGERDRLGKILEPIRADGTD